MLQEDLEVDNRTRVGIIGAGGRGIVGLGKWLCREHQRHNLCITAICDDHAERLRDADNFLKAQHKKHDINASYQTYDRMEDLIADSNVDLVMITTPQDVHEKPFVLAAKAGKIIFCEKPLAHNLASCDHMRQVYIDKGVRCMIGFTRRYEPLWVKAKQMIDEGVVGQPSMLLLRSIISYSHYFMGWWRQKAHSGNLLNEKSAHHFDVLNWFAESRPKLIHAVGGRRVFLPREGYPRHCSECDHDCVYRHDETFLQHRASDDVPVFRLKYDYDVNLPMARDLCVYSAEADVIDHAIVNLKFANGMSASLFFSIFGQHTDDQETLEVVGNEGKLLLSRHAKQIDVVSDYGKATATHKFSGEKFESGHFGADPVLIRTLSRFCRDGQAPPATFEDAYCASKTAFLAQESLASGVAKNFDE